MFLRTTYRTPLIEAIARLPHSTQSQIVGAMGYHYTRFEKYNSHTQVAVLVQLAYRNRQLHRLVECVREHGGEMEDLPPPFCVPFARNPFFTGRETLLSALHQTLQTHPDTALTAVLLGEAGIVTTTPLIIAGISRSIANCYLNVKRGPFSYGWRRRTMRHRTTSLLFLLALGLVGMVGANAQAPAGGATAEEGIWPNRLSKANSDDWIRLHHDKIRQMRPRVLVLNFVNGLSKDEAEKKVRALMLAIQESSRYHGYKDPKAPAFLDYQLFKIVDLTDEVLPAEESRLDGNSTLYPRVPDWKEGMINFQYGELFGDKFTELYQVTDPDRPARKLSLAQMVERGIVHEVWFLALQGRYGAPYECTEVKQTYDVNFRKLTGRFVQAGNGGSPEQPFINRSLRILFINAERGVGCAMESLGHAIEGMSNAKAIPYFTRYFIEYAGFDFDKRYRLPFKSLYERPDGAEVDYPTPTSLAYRYKGETYTLKNYRPIGGSVHFTPTSRRDYDMDNMAPILSTIEDYRMGSGAEGKDKAEPWTNAKFARYRPLAPDCMGPWLVYWRQNMPGLDNKAKEDDGKPMKNWWPFLFY